MELLSDEEDILEFATLSIRNPIRKQKTEPKVDHTKRLPNDVLELILFKLDTPINRLRLRSVCPRWRSLLPLPSLLPCHPWLMLAQPINQTSGSFGSIHNGRVREIPFPTALDGRIVGSTGCWLIICSQEDNRRIRLLNPFSGERFDFPKLRGGEDLKLDKIVLAPSSLDGDCIAVGANSNWGYSFAIIGRNDAHWVTPVNLHSSINDLIFHKGRLYAVCYGGKVMAFDIRDGLDPKVSTVMYDFGDSEDRYLVEWCGEILMVYQRPCLNLMGKEIIHSVMFEVYQLDLENKTRTLLKSLGDYSLFLGPRCASFSLRATDYGGLVKNNCIYFTSRDITWDGIFVEDGGKWTDRAFMGVFDMDNDGVRVSHERVCLVSNLPQSAWNYSPHVWIAPNSGDDRISTV